MGFVASSLRHRDFVGEAPVNEARSGSKFSKAAACLLLAGVAGGGLSHAQAEGLGTAFNQPDIFPMYTCVRDFYSEHPDFGLSQTDAPGQYAANLMYYADEETRPTYTGVGQEVAAQWLDKDGRPIAPHMYNFIGYMAWPEGTGLYATGNISLSNAASIDSWDSSEGDYAATQGSDAKVGSQSGSIATVEVNGSAAIYGSAYSGPGSDPNSSIVLGGKATLTGDQSTMTEAPDPTPVYVPNIEPYVGDLIINADITISSDLHTGLFTLTNDIIVTIDGDIEIVCEGMMTIGAGVEVVLTPGSRLRVYSLNQVEATSSLAKVNVNTGDPSRVMFFHENDQAFNLGGGTVIYGSIYAPNAEVFLNNDAEVYGRILGKTVVLNSGAMLHQDLAEQTPTTTCGVEIDDTPGAFSAAHGGAVTSTDTFRQWFRTLPGTNASQLEVVDFAHTGSGVYEYSASDLTLADGEMLGNEGMEHNRNFTIEFGAVAQYNKCKGQFFEFEGDGDAWLTINDRLVIDAGGLAKGKHQFADLDRLGMADGELFVLRFFYAARTNSPSAMKVRTNVNLLYSHGVVPDTSGMYD
jgi:fibro-slime domain-containing protein